MGIWTSAKCHVSWEIPGRMRIAGINTEKQIPIGRVQHFVSLAICFQLSCKAQDAGSAPKSHGLPTFCQRNMGYATQKPWSCLGQDPPGEVLQ